MTVPVPNIVVAIVAILGIIQKIQHISITHKYLHLCVCMFEDARHLSPLLMPPQWLAQPQQRAAATATAAVK